MCEILPAQLGEDRAYASSPPALCAEIAEARRRGDISAARRAAVSAASTSMRPMVGRSRARRARSRPTRPVFTSADVVGLEVGGAVKNVLALAAGMAEGLDLGTNASRVTLGLYEMQRIALAMGGRASTIGAARGSTIMGLRRRRHVRHVLRPLSRTGHGPPPRRGERLDDILADLGEVADRVAEGVDTAFALERLIKRSHKSYRLDLKFPIIFGVAEILRGDRTPTEGLDALMRMPLRPEFISRPDERADGRRAAAPRLAALDDDDARDIDFAD
ncbi:hypothetical protein JL720_16754 [Aureococcus anophagefferens]|nr:hypothetical protein JL720_16754 [Aureococcus anophagefferens]